MSDEQVPQGNDPYRQFIAALKHEYSQRSSQLDAERRRDGHRVAKATPSEYAELAITELRETFPQNTVRAWDSRLAWLENWSTRTGRDLVPASVDTLVEVIREHARLGLSPATCNLALWVLRAYNEHSGCPITTEGNYVKLARRIHMRIWKRNGNSVRQSVPACDKELTSMLAVADQAGTQALALRNRVILLLGQKAMTRRTELAALDIEDIEFIPEGIKVHVKRTVTDPDGTMHPPILRRQPDSDLCPVRAVQAWIDCMRDQMITSGPLLRMVDRHGNIRGGDRRCTGPSQHTIRLDGLYINDLFKMHAKAAIATNTLHPGVWTSRSLRSGGAIENVRAGTPEREVARMGGWDPDMPYFRSYQEYGQQRDTTVQHG